MSGRRYSLAEDEIICAMWADNKSHAEIAETLARPFWSIAKRCRRLGLIRNQTERPRVTPSAARLWTKDEVAILREMFEQGKPDAEIALRLKRSNSSVATKRYDEKIVKGRGGRGRPANDASPSVVVSEWRTLPDGTMMRTAGTP